MMFELALCIFLLFCTAYSICGRKWNSSRTSVKLPPGPIGLPIFGYLPFLGKAPCLTIQELAKKYGSIFALQLGQYPVVFINDFGKAKELFKLESTTGRAQLSLFEKRGKYGLVLLEGDEWREVRRFLMKTLRDYGFGKKSMESSIQEEVVRTISLLQNHSNSSLHLKTHIELAVINALWSIMTSEKYDLDDPVKLKVSTIMSEGLSDQNLVGIAAFLPWLAKLFPKYSGYEKGMEYFGAPETLIRDVVQRHVDTYSPGNEKDFIDHTLTKIYGTEDPKSMFYKEVGMKNLEYTLIDIFFAGSDTLSSTLGWAFLYLAMWPEIQQKVHEEIDKAVGSFRLPCLNDKSNMPFTEATMCEVMRRSAIVPLGLLHTALEDISFETFVIPKGTYMLCNIYSILHDSSYWGDPECFRPERFLTFEGTFRKDERMIPFFFGKRSCPGESLALLEYFLFFTGILQNFEFSLRNPESIPDIAPRAGFILQPPKEELFVKARVHCHNN